MKRTAYLILGTTLALGGLYLLRSESPLYERPVEEAKSSLTFKSSSIAASTNQSNFPEEGADQDDLSEELRTLLASGNINERDSDGRTALMIAGFKRDMSAFNALVKAGANLTLIDNSGQDALMNAINGGAAEIALSLVNLGASVVRVDHSGQSALSYAVGLGNVELISALLEQGANPNLVANKAGYTMVMDLAHEGQLEALSLFIASGARVDGQDNEGNTLTHHAVASGNTEVVKLVVASGAPVDTLNKKGDSPLMLAKKYNLPEIESILLGETSP